MMETNRLTNGLTNESLAVKAQDGRHADSGSEAHTQTDQNQEGRPFIWRIEPGMEDAFRDLQGWLLSSQRDAQVETRSHVQV